MPDWRIFAASLVSLVFISSVLLGGFGLPDFLTNPSGGGGGGLTDWFSDQPLTGLFASEPTGGEVVSIVLYPQTFTFESKTPISLSSGSLEMKEFTGEVSVLFDNQLIFLKEKNSDLELKLPLHDTRITSVSLDKVEEENIRFLIEPKTDAENALIRFDNFHGDLEITSEFIRLKGNVTTLQTTIDGLDWELV